MSFCSEVKNQLSAIETKKECCKNNYLSGLSYGEAAVLCDKDAGAFLRGLFIKCGYISRPGKNFMLSFALPSDDYSVYAENLLCSLGVAPKRTLRKGRPVLYYKKSEDIEDVLSLCGGTKIALDIISEKIMNDVRSSTNRLCNAETANLDRMARAAADQLEAIKKLRSLGLLESLPPELKECADLRTRNPDMSLSELRGLLHGSVSKSGLNHRFRRLIEIAESESL